MKIAFLIGRLSISGGNNVIYEHALYLKLHGHKVTIISMGDWMEGEKSWHPALQQVELVRLDHLGNRVFDLVMATWWGTVYELDKVNATHYAYFVQSIESRFFDASEIRARALVEATYGLGLPGITEASWIQRYLEIKHSSRFHLARNGIRKDLFQAVGEFRAERKRGKLRILVEGPFGVAIKNTSRTLRLCTMAEPDELWVLTSTSIKWYPGVDRIFSKIPFNEVPSIYRSCDVVVKLSYVEGMFGPPLEMFHCGGTAIVYDVSGHDEYIVHEENALVAKTDDEQAVVSYLKRLKADPEYLAELKEKAIQRAAEWPSWAESSRVFMDALERIYTEEPMGRKLLSERLALLREAYHSELFPATPSRSSIDPSKNRYLPIKALIEYGKNQLRPHKLLLNYIKDGYSKKKYEP